MIRPCLLANVDTNDGLLLSNRPSCVHLAATEAKPNQEPNAPLQPRGVTGAFLSLVLPHIEKVERQRLLVSEQSE